MDIFNRNRPEKAKAGSIADYVKQIDVRIFFVTLEPFPEVALPAARPRLPSTLAAQLQSKIQ